MQPQSQISSAEEDSVELALFREAWKAEVKRKKATAHSAPAQPASETSQSILPSASSLSPPVPSLSTVITQRKPEHAPSAASAPLHIVLTPTDKLRGGLDKYRQAVQHEQRGEFDEALDLYRQAFRVHSDIDQLYQKEEMLATLLSAKASASVDAITSKPHSGASDGKVDALAHSLETNVKITDKADHGATTGSLSEIIAAFPSDPAPSFQPEDEKQPVLLNMLPDEMIVHALSMLDTMSLERFSLVNRKARILTLDSTIWRTLVVSIYRPPQISSFELIQAAIQERFFDYRRVYIEVPRVRFDGVYIAVCHYVRPGLSENHWVNISHLITYHRYLRFFPSGQVLSLLANEEHKPQSIIPQLKPTLRMKVKQTNTLSSFVSPSYSLTSYSFLGSLHRQLGPHRHRPMPYKPC
ncbi:hypothetical protein HGRIS_005031 [Hohenbuehelia grisea]|uniref:F-box only protein 9 n=1 Tax=Hohenbuehelia grisea TaxID=104357 RepID=A0ABR3JDR5_9AGAR